VNARRRVRDFWDRHVAAWLDGADSLDPPLDAWFDSFKGTGRGAVTREGFVEPYQGDLAGAHEPRAVILGLNPGMFHLDFQSRTGEFARQIRNLGSYSAWSRTLPYVHDPFEAAVGRNRFYRARLNFVQNWLQEPTAESDMLLFELYPWHSTAVTGPMRPPKAVIDAFVFQPISEIAVDYVFAFGKPWAQLATERLGLPCLLALGRGGERYDSRVPSRAIRVYRLPSAQRLVVEWHAGAAGPPAADEVELLRAALAKRLPPRG
jgi:hypothetical protein